MQSNPAIQNTGALAWDGSAAIARDITGHTVFGFSFEATADIATDAVFTFEAAAGTDADPCVPDTFEPVAASSRCAGADVSGMLEQIVIPAGTAAGSFCSASLPCRPNKFLRMVAVSGDTANLRAVMILHGPSL